MAYFGRTFGQKFGAAFINGGKVRFGCNVNNKRSMQTLFAQLNKTNAASNSRILSAIAMERTMASLAFRNYPAAVNVAATCLSSPPLVVAAGGADLDTTDEADAAVEEDETFSHIDKVGPLALLKVYCLIDMLDVWQRNNTIQYSVWQRGQLSIE